MKKIIFVIALFGISNSIFAQKNSESKPLQKVLIAYLNLKNALVSDDSISAKTIATSLCTAIDTVNIDKLTLIHQKAWNRQSAGLLRVANKIQESTTLADQRMHFKSLSVIMHKLVGRLRINKSTLYYQYCETANAYWISGDKEIKNPYYGKKMIDCGFTKEILKGNQK